MMRHHRKRSQRQEKRVAEDVGGRVQKASGGSDFAKGDVRRRGDIKVECKTTTKKSYSLKLKDIHKIEAEAQLQAEDWAMQIEFVSQFGFGRKFAIVDWNEYLSLRRLRQVALDAMVEEANK